MVDGKPVPRALSKNAAYLRAWHAKHPDRQAQYQRKYRSSPARLRDAEAIRAKDRERQRRWREENAEVFAIIQRMKARDMPVSTGEARALLARYGPEYPLTRGLTQAGMRWLRRATERAQIKDHHLLVIEAWDVPGNAILPGK